MHNPLKRTHRRSLLHDCLSYIFSESEKIFKDEINQFCDTFPELIRPPGAGSESTFLENCQRCGNCIRACSFNVLAPCLTSGAFDLETPMMPPGTSYCRFCDDFPCIKACPGEALKLKTFIDSGKIAAAILNPKRCLRSFNEDCQACLAICQKVSNSAIKIEKGNVKIDKELCNGCGACLVACPATQNGALKLIRQ